MKQALQVRQGSTQARDPELAVSELARQIDGEGLSGVIFFCSPKYDLDELGTALAQRFTCPLVGCTSSGQIGETGYQSDGITAASFASEALTMRSFLIEPLADNHRRIAVIADEVHKLNGPRALHRRAFGLLLVDGLSLGEERLASTLYRALGDVPIVGGSAGDDLLFERTHVYHGGRFLSDAATFVLFETELPFATFKFHHFVPTAKKLVVTEADPERRIVYEIDGKPAAKAYAELVGVPVSELDARVFARNPLMLKLDGDYYVRSIYKQNPDQSLTLLCAIEAGIVLTLGRNDDALRSAEQAFTNVEHRVLRPAAVIGCDCVLRRLEFEDEKCAAEIGSFYASRRVIGFSTYGEQFNAMHINQTFTGVAIGTR